MDEDTRKAAIAVTDKLLTGGAVGTVASVLKALGIETAADRMDEAVESDWRDWVSTAVVEWHQFRTEWESFRDADRPTATDVRAVLAAARIVFEGTASSRKRRELHNAVVNAFNPRVYERGQTIRLLEVLDNLQYGDIYLLRCIADGTRASAYAEWPRPDKKVFAETMDALHAKVLIENSLCWSSVGLSDNGWSAGRGQIRVTELGESMLRLLSRPDSLSESTGD